MKILSYGEAISFEALYNSMNKCKVGVSWKGSVASYCLNGLRQTLKLSTELREGIYKGKPPVKFVIAYPKQREILSVAFRDRVYQRSLNDNIIYPEMTKGFIYDNMACQKGKGTDKARSRLKCFMEKAFRAYGLSCSIYQFDVKGYYPNMKHDVVRRKFARHLCWEAAYAANIVLSEQYNGDVGYNPGSQMVQIAGIATLDDLDHYIKEKLRIKFYIRYMDDFILIHNDEKYLELCRMKIEEILAELGFELNVKKTNIKEFSKGVMFLGFTFKPTKTGKILMLIDKNNVRHYRRKLFKLVKLAKAGVLTRKHVRECYIGWRAHAAKGNSYKLLMLMDKYYSSLWKGEKNGNQKA